MQPKKNTNSSGKTSASSGRATTAITPDNYETKKRELKRFLVLEIKRFEVIAGSAEKLSLALGKADTYVHMTTKRGSFSALERLWKECLEKIGG